MSLAARLLIAGLTAFAVLLLLAAWVFRDRIWQSFQDPGEPFQTYVPPSAADYSLENAWFARQADAPDEQPAIFFLHSTTYSGGANWNAELDKEIAVEAVEDLILPNYAGPFMSQGALWAPRYRQAALYAFLNNREDGILARRFAYEDTRRAFAAFLEQIGPDRPFLMVGVGQGGLHTLGLLIDEVAPHEALRSRLAAAYIHEAPVPLELFNGPLADIPPCETEESIRCLIAFSPARRSEERRIRILTERHMSWTPEGELAFVAGRGLLCVNPILGARTTDFADARLHRGAVAAEGFAAEDMPAPQPRQTSAQCEEGVLVIDQPRSRAFRRPNRLVEEYRVPPFNLFYEDLRSDAERRIARHRQISEEEARWAPAFDDAQDVEESPVVPIPDRAGQ